MTRWTRLIAPAMACFSALVTVGIIAGGCGEQTIYTWSCISPILDRLDDYGRPDPCCHYKSCCPNPFISHWDSDGEWDPCCLTNHCPGINVWVPAEDAGSKDAESDAGAPSGNAGDAGQSSDADAQASICDQTCLPAPPLSWSAPALVWFGKPGQEPECPSQAPQIGYLGHADLEVPSMGVCPACACDPPVGSCAPPSSMTARSQSCGAPTAFNTNFDPPPAWDGSCTSKRAIAPGAKCDGELCVRSIDVAPLKAMQTGCAPRSVPVTTPAPPQWNTSALACIRSSYPPCPGNETVCAPAAGSSMPEFSTCIFFWGDDRDCPPSYPLRHVVYDDYDDERTCAACACGPPSSGKCQGLITLYEDTACGGPVTGLLQVYAQAEPQCFELDPGVGLGSRGLTKVDYTPGSCAPSGGGPVGSVIRVNPSTFCCLQS